MDQSEKEKADLCPLLFKHQGGCVNYDHCVVVMMRMKMLLMLLVVVMRMKMLLMLLLIQDQVCLTGREE